MRLNIYISRTSPMYICLYTNDWAPFYEDITHDSTVVQSMWHLVNWSSSGSIKIIIIHIWGITITSLPPNTSDATHITWMGFTHVHITNTAVDLRYSAVNSIDVLLALPLLKSMLQFVVRCIRWHSDFSSFCTCWFVLHYVIRWC